MRKYSIIAAAAALALIAGCNKVQENVPVEGTVLTAEISSVTRTALQEDLKVKWSAGDKIMANGTESAAISSAAALAEFKFSKELTYPINALYPSSAWKDASTITLPAGQQGVEGSFAEGADMLYATLQQGKAVSFHHLLAVLKVPITGPKTIDRLVVASGDGEKISGDFNIDYSTGKLTPKGAAEGDESTVTVKLGKESPTAYVAVPAGEYAHGLLFKAFDSEGNSVEKVKTSEITLVAGTIHAFPELKFKETGETTGAGSSSEPYMLKTVEDMLGISAKLEVGKTVYFKMANDIDMSSVKEGTWLPIMSGLEANSPVINFDGDGKTISNFNATSDQKYASLFGVLNGTVKNLNFRDCKVETRTSTPIGILAGWGGISSGIFGCTVENVHAYNCYVANHYTSGNVGGLVGSTNNATYKNCSFDGTVTRTVATGNGASGYTPVGGLIGQAPTAADHLVYIENCSTTGKIIVAGGRSTGGIIGGINAKATVDIVGCRSEMDIEVGGDWNNGQSANGDVIGGICGYWGDGTLTDCSYKGNIVCKIPDGKSCFIGGIVPHTNWGIEFHRCHSEGSITCGGDLVGGILGQSNAQADSPHAVVLDQCWSTMEIKARSSVGGLIGRSINNVPLTITDCWYSGNIITSAGSGYVGGILGDAPKNTIVRNCWAGGTVKAFYGVGGVVGRTFARQGSSADKDENLNTQVTGCIAWQTSLTSSSEIAALPDNKYSNGAIVGFTTRKNTMATCVRRSDMEFSLYAEAKLNALYDMNDANESSPLVTQFPGEYTYYIPYHGKAASSGESLIAVAKRLGFNESVWDLSGATPTLKNNK